MCLYQGVLKSYWRRRQKTSSRRLQNVFIKTNVCWVGIIIPKTSERLWQYYIDKLNVNDNGNIMIFLMMIILPACNILWIFAECPLNVALFWTSREHLGNILKEKKIKKILNGKVVFALKIYDLTTTNFDPLANSSNHKAMFREYSKNIPQISVSKIFQRYPWNILRL